MWKHTLQGWIYASSENIDIGRQYCYQRGLFGHSGDNEVWEDMDELKGKEIQAKDERGHIVTDVTFFKEDAFNQSKYAVTADSGLYLYPREFILVNWF